MANTLWKQDIKCAMRMHVKLSIFVTDCKASALIEDINFLKFRNHPVYDTGVTCCHNHIIFFSARFLGSKCVVGATVECCWSKWRDACNFYSSWVPKRVKMHLFDTRSATDVDRQDAAPLNFDQQHSTVTSVTHFNGLILIVERGLLSLYLLWFIQTSSVGMYSVFSLLSSPLIYLISSDLLQWTPINPLPKLTFPKSGQRMIYMIVESQVE